MAPSCKRNFNLHGNCTESGPSAWCHRRSVPLYTMYNRASNLHGNCAASGSSASRRTAAAWPNIRPAHLISTCWSLFSDKYTSATSREGVRLIHNLCLSLLAQNYNSNLWRWTIDSRIFHKTVPLCYKLTICMKWVIAQRTTWLDDVLQTTVLYNT